jgi:3-methyladenine DNA glycosylase AlkD
MSQLSDLHTELIQLADPEKAAFFPRFFKAGPGEYAEGDIFIGVTVPVCRRVAAKYTQLSLSEIDTLIQSKWHEERLIALLILTAQYKRGNNEERKALYNFYLAHTHNINNWDLVDTSSRDIVGWHLYDHPELVPVLDRLASSPLLWERRIAMISSSYFLMKSDPSVTLHMAETLVNDSHDLIQKAVGWMLREMGKRVDRQHLIEFLAHHYRTMPRTALRYAIEHFDSETRKAYLSGTI